MKPPFQEIYDHVVRLLEGLSPRLTYHNTRHTLDVLEQAEYIAGEENLEEPDRYLLKTACLYHDLGFREVYHGHEIKSCAIARNELPSFGFSNEEIETVCAMIMATEIPQSPKNKMEEVICDADLDYLGRDDFEPIAEDLFNEMKSFGFVKNENEWNRIQLNFIGQHQYFTSTSIKRRESKKHLHLEKIRKLVDSWRIDG